jgi:hypothetical protein
MKNDNNYLNYNLEDIDLSEFENIENAEIEDRSIKIEDKRRRQKKLLRRMYDLKSIEPITENQKLAFDHWVRRDLVKLF